MPTPLDPFPGYRVSLGRLPRLAADLGLHSLSRHLTAAPRGMAARRLARWLVRAAGRGLYKPLYRGSGRVCLFSGDLGGSAVIMVTLVTGRGYRIQTIRRVMRPRLYARRRRTDEETEALFDDAVLR
jgi:hypothetical protein